MRLALAGALALFWVSAAEAQCPDGTPAPCRPAVRSGIPATNTIAVLYFDNLSRDSTDLYLADGLTEELISRLTQVEALQVKSRNAVARLRGRADRDPQAIGRELAVAQLLSGSVLRSGSRLRVHVELTRAATGNSTWARSFDRSAGDMLGVQAEIAESIAVHVTGRLAPPERRRLAAQPTQNAKAYDHFLRGRFLAARETVDGARAAVAEFQEALRLDPRMLAALVNLGNTYAGLASIYFDPSLGLSRDSLSALSVAMFDRAARVDPLSEELLSARTSLQDPAAALAVLAEASVRHPRSAGLLLNYGVTLRAMGRYDEAIAQLRRSAAIDPDRQTAYAMIAQTYHLMRNHREALRFSDSVVAMRPDAAFMYGDQGWHRLALGDTAGARASAIEATSHGGPHLGEIILAVLDARRGDTISARARLAPIEAHIAALDCVLTHPCLDLVYGLTFAGEREKALALFERIGPRGSWLWQWSQRPELDGIRSEPRFQAVVRESRAVMDALRRVAPP